MEDNQDIIPDLSLEKIIPVNIEDEMKGAYIDYAMSVIVARALPDVRDGLKPVHRRVLFGMNDLGVGYNKSHKKSARIVGEVLGKYHPHGDTSVYDAMVRMAQEWSMRYPLIDGQGNFGSVDGDSPAAMRYTEVRLKRIADSILDDIDKETVDFRLNFDDSLEEPTVLPSKVPNLLVNGSSGIAVGMATNMMPHNLSEVVDGIIAYIDNREITVPELMQYIKAPDFPTGGTIFGIGGVKEAYETGRGRLIVRGKSEIEEQGGRLRIVIQEIPYQVNKAMLVKKIADLMHEKKIEGIADVRDESDRNGMRIAIDLKKDANAQVVLNKLYAYTPIQTSFGINNVCLVNGRPRLLPLKDLIKYFVEFRHEIVVRRTKFDLRKAEERAHILEGLLIALDHLDEVIALIRASATPDIAKDGLMSNFGLSEIQSKAILEMRLQRLTGLERDKIRAEYDEVMAMIAKYKAILENETMRMDIIKEELLELKQLFGDKRRTEITFDESEISLEDIIENEKVVVTVSHLGYIKRTSLTEFREQARGGRGAKGGATREEDFIEQVFVANNHNYILIFTELGKCYWQKVYQIPEGAKTSKGRPIQNLIQLGQEDKVVAFANIEKLNDEAFLDSHYIVFCTKQGVIKKTPVRDFSRPRNNGITALSFKEDDKLLSVSITDGTSEILMAVRSGKTIRFPESKVRSMGRSAAGVYGIDIAESGDEVVGMVTLSQEQKSTHSVMIVSEKGYGKRSDLEEYRVTNRGGRGVLTLKVTEKTGQLIALLSVQESDGLMIVNKSGITIRIPTHSISLQGRNTQGVRLINLQTDDEIASVTKVPKEEEVEVVDAEVDTALIADNENPTPSDHTDKIADDSSVNEQANSTDLATDDLNGDQSDDEVKD